MEINLEHIVSSKELALDVSLIKKRLEKQEKIVVFEDNTPQFVITSIATINAPEKEETKKIGKYVQTVMRNLFAKNLVSEKEIRNLLSKEYSKSKFNINFPFIKEIDESKPLEEQKRDTNGYNRYYNFVLTAYGKKYFLCSQWTEKHYDGFETWYQSIVEA